MLQRTRKISGGCSDGTCPQIHETTDPGMIAVQGYLPSAEEAAEMEIPAGEGVVLVPRPVLNDARARA